MTTINIFEYATRNKLRFTSIKGELTLEQLWDAPLRSNDGFNLNEIAKQANKTWKATTEESFVPTTKTPAHTRLESTLEVVKFVIDVKLRDEVEAERKAKNKLEREQLLAILAEKQQGKLSEMSETQLQKRIAALSDE